MTILEDAASRVLQAVKSRGEAAAQAAGGTARFKIGLLLGIAFGLDGADKAALATVAGSLEKAFSISNLQIGLLIALVSFVGAAFTLPCGALVDWINRRRMLLGAVAVWTLAMLVSGTATSYGYLLITRLFLGAVTAIAAPAVASLVGDFIPPQARTRIYGYVLPGELVGTGIGFFVGGEISSFLSWRWAFYAMAIPSALVFWAIWRYLPEPARGGQSWIRLSQSALPSPDEPQYHARKKQSHEAKKETAASRTRPTEIIRDAGISPRRELIVHDDPAGWSLWQALRYLLRIPTYRLLIVASALGYYFFAGARAFGMIYITHHYHLPRSTVTALAAIVGVGAIAGLYGGAKVSDTLLARGWISSRIEVPAAALLVAAILFVPAIWTSNAMIGMALLTCGTAALAAANPPIDAARLDVVPSGLWGRGEAGRTALRGMLEGGAPLLFGAISDGLGGGAEGLKWTFLVMLTTVIAASAFAIPARRAYPRDWRPPTRRRVRSAGLEMGNVRRTETLTNEDIPAMQKPSHSNHLSFRQLLWHCLMGIALGVLCGGLLLQIGASSPEALLHGGDTMVARLRLLLTVAFLFGLGATFTGATFLANEKERSRSGSSD